MSLNQPGNELAAFKTQDSARKTTLKKGKDAAAKKPAPCYICTIKGNWKSQRNVFV